MAASSMRGRMYSLMKGEPDAMTQEGFHPFIETENTAWGRPGGMILKGPSHQFLDYCTSKQQGLTWYPQGPTPQRRPHSRRKKSSGMILTLSRHQALEWV